MTQRRARLILAGALAALLLVGVALTLWIVRSDPPATADRTRVPDDPPVSPADRTPPPALARRSAVAFTQALWDRDRAQRIAPAERTIRQVAHAELATRLLEQPAPRPWGDGVPRARVREAWRVRTDEGKNLVLVVTGNADGEPLQLTVELQRTPPHRVVAVWGQ